jgi:Tfp pilus assembly protein PilF
VRKVKDSAPTAAAGLRAHAPSRASVERPSKERHSGAPDVSPPCHREGGAVQTRTSVSPPSSARAPRLLRAPAPAVSVAVDMLERAMGATTPRARGIWARRGLSTPARIERTTKAMLLRQLYLAYYEERRFQKAAEVAEQLIHLRVLPDVAHQDAARAKQALGDVDAAAGHLRLAARLGPASRRAFHWWTLGSFYYLARRYDEAMTAISRAARWGTTDKPLYQGHLAVVQCARGQPAPDLPALIERLAEAPSGQGYGRFILGQMAFYDGRREEARRYLSAFVKRSTAGRAVLAIALSGELEVARQTLALLAED